MLFMICNLNISNNNNLINGYKSVFSYFIIQLTLNPFRHTDSYT